MEHPKPEIYMYDEGCAAVRPTKQSNPRLERPLLREERVGPGGHFTIHAPSIIELIKWACLVLRETPLDTLPSHHSLVGDRCSHAIWVHLRVVGFDNLRHEGAVKALLLCYGTVLVGK